jgi:hypothetical protein
MLKVGSVLQPCDKKARASIQIHTRNVEVEEVTLVHKQTIPIERPLLVGDDSTNFCG